MQFQYGTFELGKGGIKMEQAVEALKKLFDEYGFESKTFEKLYGVGRSTVWRWRQKVKPHPKVYIQKSIIRMCKREDKKNV